MADVRDDRAVDHLIEEIKHRHGQVAVAFGENVSGVTLCPVCSYRLDYEVSRQDGRVQLRCSRPGCVNEGG